MIHFTKWKTDQFELNTEYIIGNEISPYWTGKLKQDHSSLVSPLFQAINKLFIDAENNISDVYFSKFKTDFLTFTKSQFLPLIEQGKYSSELMKEYIFEEVRIEIHPELPSRISCLYLCDDHIDLIDIENTFGLDQNQYPHVIRIEGIAEKYISCKVDANWLNCNIEKYEEIRSRATKYWSGVLSENPMPEILFMGKYIITKILR